MMTQATPRFHYLIKVVSPAGVTNESYFPPNQEALDDGDSAAEAALVTAKMFLPNSDCSIVLEIGGPRHGKPVRKEVR